MTVIPSLFPRASRRLHLLVFIVLGLLSIARCACAQDFTSPLLLDPQRTITPASVQVWLDPEARAGIDQVSAARELPWQGAEPAATQPLRAGVALWMRLRVSAPRTRDGAWVLAVPLSTLDRVSFYLRRADGRWERSDAGDHVPQSAWPRQGRYPAFAFTPTPGAAAADLYLRIEHGWPTSLPLRVMSEARAHDFDQMEYLGLGGVFGGLLLLVLAACWRGWWLRDRGYGWFAAFGVAAMLGVAAYTGAAGHLLWGEFTVWTDRAPGVLCLLAGALALAVAAQLTAVESRGRWLWWLLWTTAAAAPVLALGYGTVLPRAQGVALVGAYLGTVAAMSFAAGMAAWRHGDPAGRWLMAGAVPMTVAVVLALARLFGWVGGAWAIEYATIAAIAWDLPLLKAALDGRTFERRSARLRQQALASHDPLTGLLRGGPFRARIRSAIERMRRTGEPAALIAVRVSNLAEISAARGAECAEECLLRAVIKLQSLVRDVDIVARVGDASFGILLEGVADRRATSAFASHLVATGLMEDPAHPDDPPLHFHAAIALLQEHADEHPVLDALLALLAAMPRRSSRPVRYVSSPDAMLDSLPAGAPPPVPTNRERAAGVSGS